MNKIIYKALFLCLLGVSSLYSQTQKPSRDRSDIYKSKSARPDLPYGPKNQQPWNKSRAFEETDFQQETAFELQRQETEQLRQQAQVVVPVMQSTKII